MTVDVRPFELAQARLSHYSRSEAIVLGHLWHYPERVRHVFEIADPAHWRTRLGIPAKALAACQRDGVWMGETGAELVALVFAQIQAQDVKVDAPEELYDEALALLDWDVQCHYAQAVDTYARTIESVWAREQVRVEAEALADNPGDPYRLNQVIRAAEMAARSHEQGFPRSMMLEALQLQSREDERIHSVLPGMLYSGHVCALIGMTMTGKSFFAFMVAQAVAAGCAPWEEEEPLERGRVWIITPDDSADAVRKKLRHNSLCHIPSSVPPEKWQENLVVTALDKEIPSEEIQKLQLDRTGLQLLESTLVRAREEEDPFAGIVLDAYADFLPEGADENDNAVATQIMGGLEGIAIRQNCWIWVIHHSGHVGEARAADPRHAGRGASALAAKARAVSTITIPSEEPHLRHFHMATNLEACTRRITFQVCEEGSEGDEIVRWVPAEAKSLRDYPPSTYLSKTVGITKRGLAARLYADRKGVDVTAAKTPGVDRRLAVKLIENWGIHGWAEEKKGKWFLTAKGENANVAETGRAHPRHKFRQNRADYANNEMSEGARSVATDIANEGGVPDPWLDDPDSPLPPELEP